MHSTGDSYVQKMLTKEYKINATAGVKLTNVLGGQSLTAVSNKGLHVQEHRVSESSLLNAVVQTVLEKTALVAAVHSGLTLPPPQSVLTILSVSLTSTPYRFIWIRLK